MASSPHDIVVGDNAVLDPERNWSIYTCSHGCLHVALDRVMVTLTADEFHALQHLMRLAGQRFRERAREQCAH